MRYLLERLKGRLAHAWELTKKMFLICIVPFAGVEKGAILFMGFAFVTAGLVFIGRSAVSVSAWLVESVCFLMGSLLFFLYRPLLFCLAFVLMTFAFFHIMQRTSITITFFIALILFGLFPLFFRLSSKGSLSCLLLLPAKAFTISVLTVQAFNQNWLKGVIVFGLLNWIFAAALEGLVISEAASNQRFRESKLRKLLNSIRSNTTIQKKHPLILYLRPFSITGKQKEVPDAIMQERINRTGEKHFIDSKTGEVSITVPITSMDLQVGGRPSVFELNSELEMILQEAVEDKCDFVALGQPGESFGAARLKTNEEEWQVIVKRLIDISDVCIVVPSANPGTLSEIDYLIESKQLNKCALMMPPASPIFSYQEEWQAACEALKNKINLPDYAPTGVLFRPDRFVQASADIQEGLKKIRSRSEFFCLALQALFPELPKWRLKNTM